MRYFAILCQLSITNYSKIRLIIGGKDTYLN